MDLALTKRGDYAARAAIYLARAWESGELKKIREVAADMDIPLKYTPQILNLLAKAGLVEAKAGQAGGYRLLRPPGEISLREVIEASEGRFGTDRCTMRGGPCHWDDMCPLHPVWEQARRALVSTLDAYTLGAVMQVDRQLEGGTYAIPPDSHRA